MQRVRIDLAYNGKAYFGWQRQPKQISVQEVIEDCLYKLYQEFIPIVGCGRTDTGVHAHFYVLHTDIDEQKYTLTDLKYKLNKMLPGSISIFKIQEVGQTFHARFHAVERTYRYFVHQEKNPFSADTSLFLGQPIDFKKMNLAAESILGKKDFTSFSKLHTDVHTNICDVREAIWVEYDESKWYFQISADRFLRNMVRATVGTLLEVGYGKLNDTDIDLIIEKQNRGDAKTSVPAHALFLWDVKYS